MRSPACGVERSKPTAKVNENDEQDFDKRLCSLNVVRFYRFLSSEGTVRVEGRKKEGASACAKGNDDSTKQGFLICWVTCNAIG